MTAADAEVMIEVADRAGVRLMEAFMYRLHPTWVAVREIVASGRIGRLVAVQSWFSYFNDDPANIRNIAEVGGGALYDIGCYSVNLSRMLFGAEPDRVEGMIVRDPATGTDVVTSGMLRFGDGLASFTCSTRAESDQRVHVYGTTGRISIEIPFNIPPDRPTRFLSIAGGDPPVDPKIVTHQVEAADQYAVQADAFSRSIREEAPVPTPPADAVANLEVMERIFADAAGRT
jgi:predicted dehydrogenase